MGSGINAETWGSPLQFQPNPTKSQPPTTATMDPMNKEYNPEQGLPDPNASDMNNKDIGNVKGGYKASLHNEGHSDEAHKNDEAKLKQLDEAGRKGFGETEDTPVQ